jgi:tRNA(Ile)-lysidine synthase
MIGTFRKAIADAGRIRRGDRVLVAVSGGPDSVGLLNLFRAAAPGMGLRLVVGHFNHRLRGRESAGDARFVERLASEAGLPFSLGTSRKKTPRGVSLQEHARDERISWLLATARRRNCRTVALGHTADDQAETVLIRLLGEGGPPALSGIPAVSHDGMIIHPLLGLRKRDIRAWLEKRGAAWREDRSNLSRAYLRNRVRLDLIPLLEDRFNPRIVERLADLARVLRQDNDLLDELAGRLIDAAVEGSDFVHLPRTAVEGAPAAVLSRAILKVTRRLSGRRPDISGRHLAALLGVRQDGGFSSFDFPGGMTAARDGRGIFIFGPRAEALESRPFRRPLNIPGKALFHEGHSQVTSWVRRRRGTIAAAAGAPWRAVLDADTVVPPLTVRSREDGDRVRLLGAPGDRKLKNIMIDSSMSRLLRDRVPLVCDSRGIVWAAGLRVCHRCRITSSTTRLLYLEARGSFRDAPWSP